MKKKKFYFASCFVFLLLLVIISVIYQKYYKYDFCLSYQDEEIIYRKSLFNRGLDVVKTQENHCFNFYEDAGFCQWYVFKPIYNSSEEALKAILTSPKGIQNISCPTSEFVKKWIAYRIIINKTSLELGDYATLHFVNSVVELKKINESNEDESSYELNITKRSFPYLKQRTATGEY